MKRSDALDVVIGERIRALRLERGLSQGELAAVIGVTVDDMERFEIGARRVGAARLVRIAKALCIDIGVLFGAEYGSEEAAVSPDIVRRIMMAVWDSPSRSIH